MRKPALDPRINAWREDLAAAHLRGQVDAPDYSQGEKYQVSAGCVSLRKEPSTDAPFETEFLFGETLILYDAKEGWAWVQGDEDAYVGYAPAASLSRDITAPTHRVRALRSHVYPSPDIKAPPLDLLSMNARVAVESIEDRFARMLDGRFIVAAHLAALDEREQDFVTVAERFLGTPYLWGGRTSIGLDCSALIQLSLQAAGISCPRDTDMQEAVLGEPLPGPQDLRTFRRGDIIFWKGHMGVMLDEVRLLHSNAHHMAVAMEPVAQAIARIEKAEGPVTSVRRMKCGVSE